MPSAGIGGQRVSDAPASRRAANIWPLAKRTLLRRVLPTPRKSSAPLIVPVTILVPAYNSADRIERALSSIAALESVHPQEVLVVDDGSSDDTAGVAERCGARVLRLNRNRGPSAARNAGFAAASCEWVALLDSDDECLEDHLAVLWKMRGEHVLIATAAILHGSDGGARLQGPWRTRTLRRPGDVLDPENIVVTSAAMVRRDIALEVGGFREELHSAEDLDLWFRMIERGSGKVSTRATVARYEHPGQISKDRDAMEASRFDLIKRYEDQPWWSARLESSIVAVSAWDAAKHALGPDRRVAAGRELMVAIGFRRSPALLRLVLSRWLLRRRSRVIGLTNSGRPNAS